MDHWASFQRSMRRTCELIDDIAHGREGDAPESIVLLSGDVHHCYLAQVGFPAGSAAHSAVWQAVCSAFRKELAPHEKRRSSRSGTRRSPSDWPGASPAPPVFGRFRSAGASSTAPTTPTRSGR